MIHDERSVFPSRLKNHRGTMALQCLAIVGKVNEPLYLKDVKGSTETESDNDEVDAFGFVTEQSRQELSLRKEVGAEGKSQKGQDSVEQLICPCLLSGDCLSVWEMILFSGYSGRGFLLCHLPLPLSGVTHMFFVSLCVIISL